MLGDRSMLQRREWGKNTKMECCLRDQMENLAELWIQWWMIDQCQLYHSNIIFGWTWMWCLLTSHSVLPLQSSVCQQYKTTWFDATVSKHPIRCALFFFFILVFISLKASEPPQGHMCPCHHLLSRGFTCQLQEVTMSTYGRSILTVIYIHMEK